MLKEGFHQGVGLGRAFSQAAEGDGGEIVSHVHVPLGGQGIKLYGDVLGRFFRGAQVADVVGSQGEGRILVAALVEPEGEGGNLVFHILLVQQFQAAHGVHHHVFLEVHEDGLDGLCLRLGNFLQEGALFVTVGDDGGNLGGADALDGRVGAGVLVHYGVVGVGEVLLRPGHDIGLGEGLGVLDLLHLRGPAAALYEGVHHHAGAGAVVLQAVHHGQPIVGLGGVHQRFREITGGHTFHLRLDKGFGLLKGLAVFGQHLGQQDAPVGTGIGRYHHFQHLLGLDDIQVDEAGQAVGEDVAHEGGVAGRLGGVAGDAPAQKGELSFEAIDVAAQEFLGGLLRDDSPYRNVRVGLPVSEVFLDKLNHPVRVKISGQADGHVVGDIVGIFLLADGLQGRIFQVVLGADNRLGAIGMVGEEHGIEGVDGFLDVVYHTHVLLLIDSFQFRVETAEDAVAEAVGLDAGPVLHLVGGDFLHVAGDVVAGEGVGTLGADDGHELVVFVGDGQFGGLVTHGVDDAVEGLALRGVREGSVHFEEAVYPGEQGFFGLIVLCAQDFRPLEHHVFQVVGQAGVVGRVVLSSHAHGHVGLDAGFVLVHGHVNFETVFKGVDFYAHGVSLHRLVRGAGCDGHQSGEKQYAESFHGSFYIFAGNKDSNKNQKSL